MWANSAPAIVTHSLRMAVKSDRPRWPGRMLLREEHLLGRTLHGAPLADMALQCAQHAVGEATGVVVLQLAQQRDGHQLRRALEQRHDFGVPDVGERIGARAPVAPRLL